LQQLHVPTLILAWEDDTAHPVSTATDLADTLPDVRGLVVCHPSDVSEWESALTAFVKDIATTAAVPRLRGRKKSTTSKRKRRKTAA
jgi:3-oxoadipate enol-lactonase